MFRITFHTRPAFAALILVTTLMLGAGASRAEPEVHVVGIYEGVEKTDGRIHGPEARVLVDRPGSETVLIPGAYGATRWFVDTAPGTEVTRIIVNGHKSDRSEVVLNGERFQALEHMGLGAACWAEGKAFRDLVRNILLRPDLGHLDSFSSTYTAPSEPIRITSSDRRVSNLPR